MALPPAAVRFAIASCDTYKVLREEMGLHWEITMREAYEACQKFGLEGRMYHIQRNSPRRVETMDVAMYIAKRVFENDRKAAK